MKFKSSVYTQVSGSVGGLTYSHNKGGLYSRARAIPTNPNTGRQQDVRAAMTNLVQAWDALTQENRDSWDVYAANVTVLGKLGDPISISGQNHFIRSNMIRRQVSIATAGITVPIVLAQVSVAPAVFNTGEMPSAISSAAIAAGALTIEGMFSAPLSGNAVVVAFCGLPKNDGKIFYKGPYQLCVSGPQVATDPDFTLGAAIIADPDEWYSSYTPAVGVTMNMRFRNSFVDGRLSEALEIPVTFTA